MLSCFGYMYASCLFACYWCISLEMLKTWLASSRMQPDQHGAAGSRWLPCDLQRSLPAKVVLSLWGVQLLQLQNAKKGSELYPERVLEKYCIKKSFISGRKWSPSLIALCGQLKSLFCEHKCFSRTSALSLVVKGKKY